METAEISSSRYLLVQVSRCNDAVVEVAHVQLFVRRMGVFIRQADAKEHGREPELFLEGRDHRNRAALAGKHRRTAKPLLDGPPRSLDVRIIERCHPRL